MLERVWRKGNTPTVLVGMSVGTATMENSMEAPQETKNRVIIWSSNSLLGMYLEKTLIWKDRCTLMFTAALFTMAKTRKQPKCPSTDEWMKKVWDIYQIDQIRSVAQSCPTLCDPMNRSTPGLPVHHQLPELCLLLSHVWFYEMSWTVTCQAPLSMESSR